jgi:hypothetical protein
MPNFAQQWHLLVFMPFFIIAGLAAIVAMVNLVIAVLPRVVVPGMHRASRNASAIESAASWSAGAGMSGPAENAQPVVSGRQTTLAEEFLTWTARVPDQMESLDRVEN